MEVKNITFIFPIYLFSSFVSKGKRQNCIVLLVCCKKKELLHYIAAPALAAGSRSPPDKASRSLSDCTCWPIILRPNYDTVANGGQLARVRAAICY